MHINNILPILLLNSPDGCIGFYNGVALHTGQLPPVVDQLVLFAVNSAVLASGWEQLLPRQSE
jgi:hypothetical protein